MGEFFEEIIGYFLEWEKGKSLHLMNLLSTEQDE